ncbi:MAG: aspartate aminotransferase family protein [Nitrososphaerota archaeon]|jgi:glutamate-1-semialdehyde 2,1-aminomutase|nr:aspartate aminotransferase family protein [Nitrososphaerota archaeon]MDG6942077.1 aspartate aminotransferase family protein [Nitrososphaerota archaeon]MDG6942542.1 aspartate aminotransferase family protein [Nitrososphaerota archaeon]MDG6948329.1 aspartate aminotransferase family protein [Nitrososphaerota archaeon]MDG6950255.1 aspartate aminotransferase family protein [Nitrososphaerota archaeon]
MSGSYLEATRRSGKLFERAKKVFAGGVNHNARFYQPYPLFVNKAKAQHIWDADGNRYTDYWMGHMALILGHSPKPVVDALRGQISHGTHYGMGSSLSVELAEEVQKSVPCAEMMRFCNTGAEATMYLVRLARGYTGKRTVIKMAGGWHGYNTELNKGVHRPFDKSESAGILEEEQAFVKNVRFNDLEAAERAVREAAEDTALIFLEPVLGAGGCVPAEPDYLRGLRELADKHGVLLAFDEIITGFRVSLGGAQGFYGVTPDLASFGKVAGGGLPLGLVAGRKEIVSLADPNRKERFVSIGGGTFSENPLSMAAGLATVRHLRRHAGSVYPELDKAGRDAREAVDRAFAEEGVVAHTTGLGSLFLTHFGVDPKNAEESAGGDKKARLDYCLELMSKGIFILPGHPGGISTCHTPQDLKELAEQSGKFAARLAKKR